MPFQEPGEYEVAYRAVDRNGNESAEGEVSFTVIDGPAACTFERSDEFDGNPTSRPREVDSADRRSPGLRGIRLRRAASSFPILDEIDGTRPGRQFRLPQPVPEGDDWSVTTRVTPDHETNWHQGGLMLWQSDGNFVKVGFTADGPNPDQRRFEITSDEPDRRAPLQHPDSGVAADFPATAWIRLYRAGNLIGAQFAPDVGGEPGSVDDPRRHQPR